MSKKQTLFIIGNGFDIFHGIPSSYYDFEKYLNEICDKSTTDFVQRLTKYIESNELWSNFEQALGELDDDVLREDCDWALVSYGDEDWSDSYHHDYQYELEEALKFSPQIPLYLKKWINSIDTSVKKKLSKKKIDKNAIYITFNYTDTLERVYDIPKRRVIHIHGKMGDKTLIVGHGNRVIVTAPLQYDEETDVRVQQGEGIILNYWKTTFKDVEKIIQENEKLWKRLRYVNEVYILGHSLSEVDIPYFQKIKETIANTFCKWNITYYEPEDKENFINILHNQVGVEEDFINPITMETLYRKKLKKKNNFL